MPGPLPDPDLETLPDSDLETLADGDLVPLGWLTGSTNRAMLVEVRRRRPDSSGPPALPAVYKPTAGERPLHDFPPATLTRREVAAFLVSESIGWSVVPPTVLRDGPLGEGMVQRWVEPDPAVDVVELVLAPDPRLRRVAVFDAVVNNTDRKGGHLLPAPGGHIYGVDHGICFSVAPKLRTVLWGWRGEPLTPDELDGLERVRAALRAGLGEQLRRLLAEEEVTATIERTEQLLRTRRFPLPRHDWPAVPYPPF